MLGWTFPNISLVLGLGSKRSPKFVCEPKRFPTFGCRLIRRVTNTTVLSPSLINNAAACSAKLNSPRPAHTISPEHGYTPKHT